MITYEKATANDIEQLFGLCKQLIDQYEDIASIAYDKVLKWVRRKMERSIDEYTAIYVDNQKAGYYHFFKNEDGKHELDDLYVFPAYQRQGIGSAVIRKCCASVKESVMLYVFIKNERAVALYKRLGFEVIQTVSDTRYIMERKSDLKIALTVARIVDRDIPHNLVQMERYMREAKAKGADLVCFGEAFLQGFNALSWQYAEDKAIALSTGSAEFAHIKALSQEVGIDLLFGYNELVEDCIYSSCALVVQGELLYNYRRISKGWKESSKTDGHYLEGTSAEVFEYRGRKCVIGLCGDLWEYPQRFALGEDLLLWPVYVCWTKEEWENGEKNEYAQQAKLCCENTLYVNSLCDGDAFGGAAHFLNGEVHKELPLFQEGLLYVTI